MGAYLLLLPALYLVPLGLYSPCIKEKGTLGPPPALIGHRGAPMVRHTAETSLTLCTIFIIIIIIILEKLHLYKRRNYHPAY